MVYKIPVIWQMYGVIEVKADTLSQAIEIVEEKPLPEGHYIDDSFLIDREGITVLNPKE